MNADRPVGGLAERLRLLNFDGRYGLGLLIAAAVLLLPELDGGAAREALGYQREALSRGEAWRALTAHFVHLDLLHAALNAMGVVLVWALFARDYPPRWWFVIYVGTCLGVSAGLWFFSPDVPWYVGASGALHGVMTAGTLAHLRRGDLDGWILAVCLTAKLAYEQFAGALPFAGSADTIVDAHLYGALAGVLFGWLAGGKRQSA